MERDPITGPRATREPTEEELNSYVAAVEAAAAKRLAHVDWSDAEAEDHSVVYELFVGACILAVVVTICLVVLHWAGVLGDA